MWTLGNCWINRISEVKDEGMNSNKWETNAEVIRGKATYEEFQSIQNHQRMEGCNASVFISSPRPSQTPDASWQVGVNHGHFKKMVAPKITVSFYWSRSSQLLKFSKELFNQISLNMEESCVPFLCKESSISSLPCLGAS